MSARINPWPWGIGIFIGCFAMAMTAFVIWSLRHRKDLVASDYYERELLQQGIIERTARAQAEGVPALRYDAEGKALRVDLPAEATGIELALYRPSDASLDEVRVLKSDNGAPIVSGTANLAPGLWRATLEWTRRDEGYRTTLAFVVE